MLERRGQIPDEIKNRPKLPQNLKYIWNWYIEIKCISDKVDYTQIKAWSDLKGIRLHDYELQSLVELERVRRRL